MQGSVRALKAALSYISVITIVYDIKTIIHKNTHIMHIKTINRHTPLN